MMAISKIKGFLEKNDLRKKINAFYEIVNVYKSQLMEDKANENEIVARSLANDSIMHA
jgi:hypothetical protein